VSGTLVHVPTVDASFPVPLQKGKHSANVRVQPVRQPMKLPCTAAIPLQQITLLFIVDGLLPSGQVAANAAVAKPRIMLDE
jgi:hypothetical protein